ncbi:hypothetical protein [Ruegeria lacuscaerulensis]|uniref:hypothetical protein n=1 Tax=Ruegeria lacuscaerulensis TaxID=55218 RepID=UPI00147AF117|nr:hypothetical protein [Ruegeria lacuscaerulensis]
MPTLGWRLEDDTDAVLHALDVTPDPSSHGRATAVCPFCAASFDGQRELLDHVHEAHRVERPSLLIRGGEAPSKISIRSEQTPSKFVFLNTDQVRFHRDGTSLGVMGPAEAADVISSAKNAELELELLNISEPNAAAVTTRIRISARVADEQSLQSVEQAFTENLLSLDLSRAQIRLFLADRRTKGQGEEYASALAAYCLGILLKERPETESLTTAIERYREQFGAALNVLKDFDRPLAKVVSGIIRFSLNDFESGPISTGFGELDYTRHLIADPRTARFELKLSSAKRVPACLLDHGTGRILELAVFLSQQDRWSPILEEECRMVAKSEKLDAADREKALAVWAALALRLGTEKKAVEPLQQIAGVYPFSRWAGSFLEEVSL